MERHAVRLSSGNYMPLVGLGTWRSTSEEIENAVGTALEQGYKHIDTAAMYQNEEAIGRVLKKWFHRGGKREDIFITTKLPIYGNTPRGVEKYMKLSLERLQLDYVDLYLVHNPLSFVEDPKGNGFLKEPDGACKLELDTSPLAVWKEMENQVKLGRTKSIGLSNFNEKQIQHVWDNAEIKPSNLQIELHAYFQQRSVRELCKRLNISVTSYGTLGSLAGGDLHRSDYVRSKFPPLLTNPVVKKIADAHNKTTAQVLLRHLIQQEILVIPKSANPQRIKSNFELFDFVLTKEESDQMDALDQGPKGRMYDFLFFRGAEKHPDFPLKEELNL